VPDGKDVADEADLPGKGLRVNFKIVKSKLEEEVLSMRVEHPMTPNEITRMWEKDWGVPHATRLKFEAPADAGYKWVHRNDPLPPHPAVTTLFAAAGNILTALAIAFRKHGWRVEVHTSENFGKEETWHRKNVHGIDPVLEASSDEDSEEEEAAKPPPAPAWRQPGQSSRKAFSQGMVGRRKEPMEEPDVLAPSPYLQALEEQDRREREEQARQEKEILERLERQEREELERVERENKERLEREEEERRLQEQERKRAELQRQLEEKAEADPKAREQLEKRRAREEANRKRREAMAAKKQGGAAG